MEISENQNKAVDEIVEMVVSVIGNGSREIDTTEEGFGTAIYHYIEGTKTFPPEFSNESDKTTDLKTPANDNTSSKDESKPWWKFWEK
ncbi:MAG: hypothetical protein RLN81_12295 [Balneolaceae bacterium]